MHPVAHVPSTRTRCVGRRHVDDQVVGEACQLGHPDAVVGGGVLGGLVLAQVDAQQARRGAGAGVILPEGCEEEQGGWKGWSFQGTESSASRRVPPALDMNMCLGSDGRDARRQTASPVPEGLQPLADGVHAVIVEPISIDHSPVSTAVGDLVGVQASHQNLPGRWATTEHSSLVHTSWRDAWSAAAMTSPQHPQLTPPPLS